MIRSGLVVDPSLDAVDDQNGWAPWSNSFPQGLAAPLPGAWAAAPVESATAASTSLSAHVGDASIGTTRGLQDVLFPTNSSGTPDFSVSAINQGSALGDCYFLSELGEIAIQHPGDIADMIMASANGTETVTLYERASGGLVQYDETGYKRVQFTVSNSSFYNGGGVTGQPG